MRVAIVTESYRPDVNGVSHSVQRVVEHLLVRGHDPLVIAPEPEWGTGYRVAGHRPVLVVPGDRYDDTEAPQGRVITVPGPVVPGTGGYRLLVNRQRVARLLDALAPDRLEVSDRTTLRWTGDWARAHGVPSVMVSHERLDALLHQHLRAERLTRAVADHLNAGSLGSYDRVVCSTAWAAAEFRRLGPGAALVPLGVDLDLFHPGRYDARLRESLARPGELLVVQCTRLSPEKRPHRGIDAVAALRERGVPAVGVLAGGGPLRGRLERRAAGLPVRVLGFVADRVRLATADVVVAPGPVETFGLAALEALACGTPVVAAADGALPEVVGGAGTLVHGEHFADGILQVAALPAAERRRTARRRAEQFGWDASIAGMLAVHGLAPHPAREVA